MPRRPRARLAALIGVVALLAAACGTNAGPALTDPIEIVVQSIDAIQDTKTVRIDAELDGELPFDLGALLEGGGGSSGGDGGSDGGASDDPGSGGTLDISGTTLGLDLDIEDEALRLEFLMPALLNLEGEIIVVDESAYVKVSLLGDKYQRFEASDAGDVLPIPSLLPDASTSPDPSAMLDELRASLQELDPPPTKLADETCGDATCYHVQLQVDQEDAGSLGSFAPDVAGTMLVDYYVRTNDLRPALITVSADAGEDGTFSARLTFSGWDADLTISPPPADQVEEGTLPGLDGLTG
jgi:hypothetical protein